MPLDISIPTTSVSDGPKPFTKYAIRIAAPLRTTILHKRYSDFSTLHALLTTQVGAAPPAPLPGKSWLGVGLGKLGLGLGSTSGSPEMVEERRKGLEAYLQAIENSDDGRWRVSEAWRKFLELGAAAGRNGSVSATASGLGKDAIQDASDWLDAHAELKSRLQEARLWLTRREQASTANAQHEAGANAKRGLVQAGTLIQALEQALERLSGKGGGSDWGGEKLGDGEVRRRRDMIGTVRKEKEGLEGVLNAMAVNSAASSAQGSTASASASSEQKSSLFKGATGGGRRVLGAPAKETERTRELDNDGVLQLQQQIMAEQDEDVQDLSKVVRRMREMGVQINEEIVLQNQMLGLFEEDVDRYVTVQRRTLQTFVLVMLTIYTESTARLGLRERGLIRSSKYHEGPHALSTAIHIPSVCLLISIEFIMHKDLAYFHAFRFSRSEFASPNTSSVMLLICDVEKLHPPLHSVRLVRDPSSTYFTPQKHSPNTSLPVTKTFSMPRRSKN
jgi:regulator of vacuolar morphogenesis